jgi:hypothetical protein
MFKDIMNPTKTSILNQMNPPQTMQVEEEVILFNAPIKNQNKGNNVSFQPVVESLIV